MTDTKMLPFARLIASSYSDEEAQAFGAFCPDENELARLEEIGRGVIADCSPPLPGACMLMSALFASRLREITDAPVHVFTGALSARSVSIFGDRDPTPAHQAFDIGNPSWDGHAWVMFGPHIADASLLRTARSPRIHPVLRTHVAREFNPRDDLLIYRYVDAPRSGFRYAPRHALTSLEIIGLSNGARHRFKISE